jgi:hypothetical protein
MINLYDLSHEHGISLSLFGTTTSIINNVVMKNFDYLILLLQRLA